MPFSVLLSSNLKYYNDSMSKTIAEVAAETGFSTPTLRYYEQEGLLPRVPRDGAGNRIYGEAEMAHLNVLRCLRSAGLSLAEVKHYFKLVEQGEETLLARRDLMIQAQARMQRQFEEIEGCLRFLDHKIRYYDTCCAAQAAGRPIPAYRAEVGDGEG